MKDRMTNYGLSKLLEELGEVQQVIGKMLQFPECFEDPHFQHPDGVGSLHLRLAYELGDVLAAIDFVMPRLLLPPYIIQQQRINKLTTFERWDLNQERE